MLKSLVANVCPDLSARLRDIAEKQVPAKLKPMEGLLCLLPGLVVYIFYENLFTVETGVSIS